VIPLNRLNPSKVHLNIEIKAKSGSNNSIRKKLKLLDADFRGTDNQSDTYFNTKQGRLKLREGNIENNLIYYRRENSKGPKQSNVILYKSDPGSSLKEILTEALGILITVKKQREIYFIDNVKFHLDTIKNLGSFVEIEAIDTAGNIGKDKLLQQCKSYMTLFEITEENLISDSYSDLILNKQKNK
jgi:adenylate cyclase, class 2